MKKDQGDSRELNPGPPAPKAGIIPLDHYPITNPALFMAIYRRRRKNDLPFEAYVLTV